MHELSWGILAGLGCGLNWAVTSLLVRALLVRFSPAGVNAVRAAGGGGILIALAVVSGQGPAMLHAPLWTLLALGAAIVVGMVVGDSLFFRSMEALGVTRALTLSLLNPLLSTLTGIVLYQEPVTLLRFLGIALVLLGLGLIVSGKLEAGSATGRASRRGVRMVLIAAACWAFAATTVKPALLVLPVFAGTALRIPMAALVLWLGPWTRGTLAAVRQSSSRERWYLVLICLLNVLGSALFTVAIRSGGVAIGNALASTSPLFAIPLEILVLKKDPSRRTIAGAVLAVAGIACLSL
ncbi:MAG: DMT family transporter [Candidatus Methylomirabilota bacterium]